MSAFVDKNIKEAITVPKLKSYIKDTTYFIHKVENLDVPPNAILFTFDVVSLYKNIPSHEGMLAVVKYLRRNKPTFTTTQVVLHLHK